MTKKIFLVIIIAIIVLILLFDVFYVLVIKRGNLSQSTTSIKNPVLGDCLHELYNAEVPLRVVGDISFQGEDIIIKSPNRCNNRFEIKAKIADFGLPITREIPQSTSSGKLQVTSFYYIGDWKAYFNEDNKKALLSKGFLKDLNSTTIPYLKNNALVTFYWNQKVYYIDRYIYVQSIFFNEEH